MAEGLRLAAVAFDRDPSQLPAALEPEHGRARWSPDDRSREPSALVSDVGTIIARSVTLFILAGLCEVGGGYLVWLWLRDHRGVLLGGLGGALLLLYGVLPTLQPAHFGRVYAAYGGVFVVLSLLWGWWIDGHRPDIPDVVGGALCLAGVAVMMYWPRPT